LGLFRSSSVLPNTPSSENSAQKKVELEANSTFLLWYVKRYSSYWSFVLSHEVIG